MTLKCMEEYCNNDATVESLYCYNHALKKKRKIDLPVDLVGKLSDFEHLPNKAAAILLEASTLINGPRPEDYGDACQNFQNSADILRVLVRARYGVDLVFTADFFALVMAAAVKVPREAHKHKHDSVLDAIGYLALLEKVGAKDD